MRIEEEGVPGKGCYRPTAYYSGNGGGVEGMAVELRELRTYSAPVGWHSLLGYYSSGDVR